jgi:hypothetical protein
MVFADVLIWLWLISRLTVYSLQSTAHGLYQDNHVLWGVIMVVDLLYRCLIL